MLHAPDTSQLLSSPNVGETAWNIDVDSAHSLRALLDMETSTMHENNDMDDMFMSDSSVMNRSTRTSATAEAPTCP